MRTAPILQRLFARLSVWQCLVCALLCLLCACSSTQEDPYAMPKALPATSPEKIVWQQAPGAITVILDAESDSNLIDGTGHATSICIMQVPDAEKLKAMGSDEAGLRSLLACKPAPPDIISALQLFVQPGEYRVFPMDRMEGVKHIAVAAGFNTLTPEGCLQVVPVPVHQDTERSWVFFSHPVFSPADMKLSVTIGQATIAVQGVEREN